MDKPEIVLLEQILKEVQGISTHISDLDTGLDRDRHCMQDISVQMATAIEQNTQILRAINTTSEKVKNKVADIVEPITDATDRLTNRIEKSKMVVLKTETKKWWQKFFKGVR
jgi:hypothetical protein